MYEHFITLGNGWRDFRSSQAGTNVIIKLDAADAIILDDITLSSLVAADFEFV